MLLSPMYVHLEGLGELVMLEMLYSPFDMPDIMSSKYSPPLIQACSRDDARA